MRGRFITFEGGEGTGKSTQASTLARRLEALAVGVVLTREPGGSSGAEIVRHVLLSGAAKPLGTEAEAILFAAARDDHLTTLIRPALERGQWVICDRFIDSTRVYQGDLGAVDRRIIRRLERVVVGDTMPDLTFILDLPAEVGLERARRRRGNNEADRFETETLEFHARLRDAYLAIAAAEPQRCVVIDSQRPKNKVADEIWAIVNRRLDPAAAPVSLEDVET
ncbi:dTMP kinase [Xanthobacteraceae bacterium Astr-EGSB]|uniref:dTMP kinase n=1 Tax=Astrobacterium formosum TaxID=3069710 RepID=UPI0027B0BEB6|nr:dTMP kinase [Xanthobacteraceae bacterium Astr-EGSB]